MNSVNVRIWVDVMWWEGSFDVMVPPTLKFIRDNPEIDVTIFWNSEKVQEIFSSQLNIWSEIVRIHWTQNDILDNDKRNPLRLLANGKNSSIYKWILSVKSWEIDGFLSRWNTWAYVAAAKRELWNKETPAALSIWMPRLDLNDRSNIPNDVLCMDVWAEMDTTVEKLVSNAELGVSYLRDVKWIENPRVWLMNVGEESYKWDKAYRDSHKPLKERYWEDFVWNIETNKINTSLKADLIVSWWMLWNGVLKWAEWTSETLRTVIRNSAFNNKLKMILWSHVYFMMRNGLGRFHPDNRPDGTLHGVNGKIVKVHGSASSDAVYKGLENMVSDIQKQN